MRNATLATRRHVLGLGLFTESLKYFAGWILTVIILAAVVPLIASQWRSIEISAWAVATNVGKYLVAIVAGGYVYTLLPTMVAQGLTRRELATAMGIFGLLWSAAIGALAIAGFIGEHALYTAFDWSQAMDQGSSDVVLGSYNEALEFAVILPLIYLLYFTGGALIGAAIYRSDSGWLVLIPVIPITLAIDDALSSTEAWGPAWLLRFVTVATNGWGTWMALGAAVVVIVVGAWITRRIIIDTPIRAKKA